MTGSGSTSLLDGVAHRGRLDAVRAHARRIADEDEEAETLLAPLSRDAGLVTLLDGAPAALSWLGGVRGHRVSPLGLDRFGASGKATDLFPHFGFTAEAIVPQVLQKLGK